MSVAEDGVGAGGLITLKEESLWSPLDKDFKFDSIINFRSTNNTDSKLGPSQKILKVFVKTNSIIVDAD